MFKKLIAAGAAAVTFALTTVPVSAWFGRGLGFGLGFGSFSRFSSFGFGGLGFGGLGFGGWGLGLGWPWGIGFGTWGWPLWNNWWW